MNVFRLPVLGLRGCVGELHTRLLAGMRSALHDRSPGAAAQLDIAIGDVAGPNAEEVVDGEEERETAE